MSSCPQWQGKLEEAKLELQDQDTDIRNDEKLDAEMGR